MKCLHYIFYADPQNADNKVQMLFRETTGREVRLHMIPQFRFHGSSGIALAPDIERLLFFFIRWVNCSCHLTELCSASPQRKEKQLTSPSAARKINESMVELT